MSLFNTEPLHPLRIIAQPCLAEGLCPAPTDSEFRVLPCPY